MRGEERGREERIVEGRIVYASCLTAGIADSEKGVTKRIKKETNEEFKQRVGLTVTELQNTTSHCITPHHITIHHTTLHCTAVFYSPRKPLKKIVNMTAP